MRPFISASSLVLLAAVACSCSSSPPASTSSSSGTPGSYVVMSAGKAVLNLTLPAGAKTTERQGMLTITDPTGFRHFNLWTVTSAKNVAAATGQVQGIIQGEFLEFIPSPAQNLTIAGAPAVQLNGPGKEADDSDPGHAEVVLFTVGGRVFAACVHGEGEVSAPDHAFMLGVIQTARVP